MKIYFDGCSWTWGGELEENESERFSAIISKEMGAEEHNFSRPMASNDRILRQLLIDNNIKEYDMAIIQMSYPSRTEYYDESRKEFVRVGINATPLWKSNKPRWHKYWDDKDKQFWFHYYSSVYNEHYGTTKENIIYQNIKDHCKANDVPLFLMTINNWDSNLNFDLELERDRYPKARGGHPNVDGHKLIASDILKLL